ncbi:MAG: hypothetical protein RJA34_3046 [Pseudomonadota bacterium]|jgi:hypothetical protein
MGSPREKAKIEKYVDAVRAYRALIEAQRLEGKTEERTREIKMAQATVRARAGSMRGGSIGKANRILAGDAFPAVEAPCPDCGVMERDGSGEIVT